MEGSKADSGNEGHFALAELAFVQQDIVERISLSRRYV